MATRRTHPVQRRVLVDEFWLREWCELGFIELAAYLENWAAFGQYLREKEKQ